MIKYPYHKPEVTKSDILKAKIGVSRSKMVEPLLKKSYPNPNKLHFFIFTILL